ncbi:P-loop containing nucleoside triphosphate hydrolase protein [Xylogone sp. PMI_703]|nr:P-loop containing nucleoside triphosphate hydrolase protein [Xylogone sp. PMI_703]
MATVRDKLLYGAGTLAAVGSGTVLPLMTLIFGNFVSVFTDFALDRIPSSEFRSKIDHYTLYFIYMFIAKLGCTYIYMVLFSIVAANINSALRRRYLHVVLHESITYHETTLTSGQVSLALSTNSNAIRSGLAEKFGLSLKSASTVVAAFVVALHSQWKLALVTATIIPAAVIAVGITSVFDEKKEQSLNAINAEAATLAEDIMSSIRTVRSLGAERKFSQKYASLLKKAIDVGLSRAPIKGIQAGIYMFVLYGGYALAFWYGIKLYADGEAAHSGAVITTLFSIMIGVNGFSELAGYLGAFMRIHSAGAELFKVIDRAGKASPSGASVPSPDPTEETFQRDITFDNVSFRYPTRPKVKVLDRFTLRLPVGKTTALVGPSGSGKSTIVGLLLRWYDPAQGQVKIGDHNLSDIPLKTLRAHIGLVQQEPSLFTGTVYENIENGLAGSRLENLSHEEKRELVYDACKLSNAHDFITKLPNGYDTPIGNRGTMLSGGQKQRLAIARAIVKDPSILVLDEATSALDVTSEAIVQQALENARQQRTTISIAHRLSTIRAADQIVVMRKGAIVEVGSHDNLLENEDGTYRRLWEAQALAQDQDRSTQEHLDDSHEIELQKQLTEGASYESTMDQEKTKGIKKRSVLDVIRAVMSAQKKHWWIFLIVCASATIGGALFPLQAFLYAKVVNTFQLTGHALVSRGNFWALMWFVLAIVVGFGYLGISWGGSALGELLAQQYRLTYFKSMISQPISFFDLEENSSGSLVSRLSTDPDAVNALAGDNVAVLVTVGVALVSTVTLALAIGWKLGLVVLFGGLPLIFGAGVIHERMENSFEEKAGKMFTESVGYAGEHIQAIRTISALNMEIVVERHFGQMMVDYCQRAARYAIRNMLWFSASDSIDLLCMALAFWYGGRLLSFHEYSTIQFFIVFIAIIFGSQSMGQFFAHSSDISKGFSSTRDIYALGDSVMSSEGKTHKVPPISELDPATPLIEFRNATFAYPARPLHPVLKQFNLKLYPAQSIALVGPSGCGKSTIIQLLNGFYNLAAGEILIAGIPIQNYLTEELHKLFALVSQEPVLYQGSIEENINLGRSSAALSEQDLQGIITQSQLSDLVSSLPEGVQTMVGSRGTQLSGGQKQRVAIARAIAMDAPILLLDEATSALDSESEALIQKALKEGSRGKSVISVAHRLSTIQHCDCIFVLDRGVVIESGTHAELLKSKGRYWAMVISQAGERDS